MSIISNTHQSNDTYEVVQVLISLCQRNVKKENNDIISHIKDLREETNDFISYLKDNISTLEKKVDSLIVEFDNINQYEYRDGLVISRDTIPHGTSTENSKEIVLNLFWHHLNTNFGESELSIAHHMGEKPINGMDNQKNILKTN